MNRRNLCLEWLTKAVSEHNSDECLIWPFKIDRDGYGRLRPGGERITVGAHRLAFKLANGHYPTPCGLHKCDTPGCVNPRHVWEGTDKENHEDQVAKGRTTKGTMQADAKLTEEIVAQARDEYAGGKSFAALAEKYSVTKPAMRQAIRGDKTWKHVPGRVTVRPTGGHRWTHCKRGHALTEANCYIYGRVRQCMHCTALRARKVAL